MITDSRTMKTHKTPRIGYQGAVGSNSEKASMNFVEKTKWVDTTLIPCFDSKGVVTALLEGKADYGVLALNNVIAGDVAETKEALSKINFKEVDTLNLSINHCLCTLPGVVVQDISEIISHPHALFQVSIFLDMNFSATPKLPHQDTALAAMDLKDGKLKKTTAVITTVQAAKACGLVVHYDSIANTKENFTKFIMITEVVKK